MTVLEHRRGIQQDPHHFGTLAGWPSQMNSKLENSTATYPQLRSGCKGSPGLLILLGLQSPDASNLPGLSSTQNTHSSKRPTQSHLPLTAVPPTAREWHHRRRQDTSALLGSQAVSFGSNQLSLAAHWDPILHDKIEAKWTVLSLEGLNKTKLHLKKYKEATWQKSKFLQDQHFSETKFNQPYAHFFISAQNLQLCISQSPTNVRKSDDPWALDLLLFFGLCIHFLETLEIH